MIKLYLEEWQKAKVIIQTFQFILIMNKVYQTESDVSHDE